MKSLAALHLAVAISLGVGGCATSQAPASIDTTVCVESYPILRQMVEVLSVTGGSPVALNAYLERMTYMQSKFKALEPRGWELAEAHRSLSDTIDAIIVLSQDPDPRATAAMAASYAELEVVAMEYFQACMA